MIKIFEYGQVTNEEILAQAKKDFPYSKALHRVLETKTMNAGMPNSLYRR